MDDQVKLNLPDPSSLAKSLANIAERSQKLTTDYLARAGEEDGYNVLDPAVIAKTWQEMAAKALANPQALVNEQIAFWTDYTRLWGQLLERVYLNQKAEPLVQPTPEDKRFKDPQWVDNFVFDFIKQCYLLAAGRLQAAVGQVEGLDPHTAKKAAFYTRQLVDALSPTNFAATNPQVFKATLESGGENLLKGMEHLLQDLERGKGRLSLKMTDLDAFRLGENIAATPGKVIYQNELMQLLQYSPTTDTVYRRPLLIVPPWINKFYVLDLKPKNSFIKWAVDQGHTVFIISWVNPDESLARKHFQDYLLEGPLAALDAIEQATGETEINAIGYCIGGTLLASTLAYMAVKGDKRVVSGTFFTTMTDFSDVGELSVFIDDEQLTLMEHHMERKGYLEGQHMAGAFNLLRENDLIWSFVINNYLLGREPMPFDMLYWNSDSTRMPAVMHSFYVRNLYERNLLREPGGITLAGVPIDLGKIEIPTYFLSTREDHIAPWKSTYAGARLVSGEHRFVLGGSGHIAGVMNPPAGKKYCYWTNAELPASPDDWLAGAARHEGSWWSHWAEWVGQLAGERVPARHPGDGKLAPIEDAPGAYVKVRLA
ncbi:MAG: class I poly(R)-hydroxyalkanoic acid synthase [Betaproteobacteria bacterium]|nr:class I poly(R)-hydroxyalkanoic acid synthase [Betaproteobacteria bacterium]